MGYDTNGITREWVSRGRSYVVVPRFYEKPAGACLNARACLTSSCRPHKGGKLTSYCQVVHNLLNNYATDNIIVEANADIMNYKQPQDLNAIDY